MLEFYGRHFIPRMPADTSTELVCRTIGQGRVVDELIFRFTHDLEMDWMLPGVPPTGRRVEVPLVVQLAAGRIAGERIYWDQAPVLAQLGLLECTFPMPTTPSAPSSTGPSGGRTAIPCTSSPPPSPTDADEDRNTKNEERGTKNEERRMRQSSVR